MPASGSPLRQLPNALTLLRLAAIPVFVILLFQDRGGPSWPAGIVFGAAGVTDQLDGYLARRWRVESQFGKIADPLADRIMIGLAVVLLVGLDRLPWAALVLLARDVALIGGYKLVASRGYEFEVNQLGKIATWGLYAAVGFVLVTARGTLWPQVVFWVSLGVAVLAAVQYLGKARREVGRSQAGSGADSANL